MNSRNRISLDTRKFLKSGLLRYRTLLKENIIFIFIIRNWKIGLAESSMKVVLSNYVSYFLLLTKGTRKPTRTKKYLKSRPV